MQKEREAKSEFFIEGIKTQRNVEKNSRHYNPNSWKHEAGKGGRRGESVWEGGRE